MLADEVDNVIGVDTHRDTNTAQALTAKTGAIGPHTTTGADSTGYRRMLAFADEHTPGSRVWAIESTGSYGAGLTAYLHEHGERVVEIDRPKRGARRNGAKSDELDALRAAREALGRRHLAEPRRRGEREAIRVLLRTRQGAVRARVIAIGQLKSLIVTAPEGLRSSLRRGSEGDLAGRCARLRICASQSVEHRMTVRALRCTARRALALEAEAAELEAELRLVLEALCPRLLAEPGVGTISAAELINAWSHPGRIRSEAAFAMLAGAAPIPASSGQTVRHRLNRCGDRQLNRALHTITTSRLRHDSRTRAYAQKRRKEGKTPREIRRCLKRYVARQLFRLLEAETKMA
jgi:transposase